MSSRQDGLHRTAAQELLGFVLTAAAGAIEEAGLTPPHGRESLGVQVPWILRILMFAAAPIAGLFVARDTLNFTILQTMITILLIIGVLILVAVWPRSK